jgi:hypothetical protein
MKAERRHELQENTLAQALSNFPALWAAHGNKVLLVVIAIALVILLVRYRQSSQLESARLARESLATARLSIGELRETEFRTATATEAAQQRRELASQAAASVETVLRETPDGESALRAEAHIVRGDLYWTLANLSELPGAATQEALRLPQPQEELLTSAASAYEQALRQFGDQRHHRAAARFGLAAVAENRRQFDVAQEHYQQIEQDEALPANYRELARARLNILPRLRDPLHIGAFDREPPTVLLPETPDEPATPQQPAQAPAGVPATLPATAPALAPAEPAPAQ